MKSRKMLSQYWLCIQGNLFPWMEECLGDLSKKQQQLISTLEIIRLEEHIFSSGRCPGRPLSSRAAIARAFIAKAIYSIPTTRALLDRLECDIKLRRICGWEKKRDIPSESLFSRAFGEFSTSRLPERVHEALIELTHQDRLVGHISRDSTAVEAREKPIKKEKTLITAITKKRGRPKKGLEPAKVGPTRIERQLNMNPQEMRADLPTACDVGTKKNSKGYKSSWTGYKLHIDTADGGVPISCVLTSASTHDSQVAIPLAEMTAQRITNLYDLMDAAYDDKHIIEHSKQLGHVPIIDINPRRNIDLKNELLAESKRKRIVNIENAESIRYKERSTAERSNARLKDDFGARFLRVRGHTKVMCHLMFGILALTVEQLLRFVT